MQAGNRRYEEGRAEDRRIEAEMIDAAAEDEGGASGVDKAAVVAWSETTANIDDQYTIIPDSSN